MTDKEKIRTEIERRYKYNKEHENDWAGTSHFWQRKEDEEILSFIDSLQEESISKDFGEEPKECIYSKDNYTDEDRKVLCEGCEEECEFNKKDEIKSVHAQHTIISSSLNDYLCKAYNSLYEGNGGKLSFARLQNMAIDITEWQKQQTMKGLCYETTVVKDSDGDGIDSEYSEWLELEMNEIIELPEGLKLEEGDKVKVIIIKED